MVPIRAPQAETLGYGVDDNGVFVDIFELSDGCKLLAAVNEFTVNFVADNKQVVFFCDIRNGAQLFMSQNNAGGVAGVGEHDCAGVFVDKSLELFAESIAITAFGEVVRGRMVPPALLMNVL